MIFKKKLNYAKGSTNNYKILSKAFVIPPWSESKLKREYDFLLKYICLPDI